MAWSGPATANAFLKVPSGNTADRVAMYGDGPDGSPYNSRLGQLFFNTVTGRLEIFNGTEWKAVAWLDDL